jgi:ketosteroid isomerase-like protein
MKLGHVALLALVTALTLTLGFGLAQGDNAKALETLEGFLQQYEDAVNQQDAEAFGQLWTEDAKLLDPNGPILEGRETMVEIQGFSPENVGTFELSLEATEAISFGDMLHGIGTYTIADAEGQVLDEGKFMGLYKQVDGGLQLSRLSPNTNLPLPEAPAGDSTMTGGGN